MPLGSDEVVMLTGAPAAAMTMLKPCDAVSAGELESFTCTVIANVPDCVGVPGRSIRTKLLALHQPAKSRP